MASKKFDINNLNESLKNYLNGSFNANERALFEAEMAKNEFLQNAFDGLKSSGLSMAEIEREKRQIKNQLKIKSNIYFKRGLIFLSAAAILIFAIFILKNNPKKTEFADKENPKKIEKIEEKTNPIAKDSITEKPELKIETLAPKKEKKFLKKTVQKPSIISQPQETDTTLLMANTNVDSVQNVSEIVMVEPNKQASSAEIRLVPEIPEFNNQISNSNFQTIEKISKGKKYQASKPEDIIPKYEFIVYDTLYADVAPEIETVTNNVEAKFENKDSKNSLDKGLKKEIITYDDFIKLALEKLKKNQFEQAKNDFELILQQYKNDENALYYLGFCFYQLNNPSAAQTYFERIEASENNFYKADAEWHLALIYGQLGEIDEMKQRLTAIKNKNNNYSQQAALRLEKMK